MLTKRGQSVSNLFAGSKSPDPDTFPYTFHNHHLPPAPYVARDTHEMAQNDDGLGHKLLSLLPLSRHATFRIRLTIHDVTNIPFQNGSFALRWKFKNAKNNVAGQRPTPSRPSTPFDAAAPLRMTNGTARAGTRMNSLDSDPGGSLRTSLDSDYRPGLTASEKGKNKPLQLDVPRLAVTIQPPTPTIDNTSPVSQTTTSKGDHSPTSTDPHASTPVSIESIPAPIKSTASPNPEPPTVRIEDTTHKGCTEYVPLKDHTVRWNHTVDVNVDFKVKRETHELMPCELKLVLQEVSPSSPRRRTALKRVSFPFARGFPPVAPFSQRHNLELPGARSPHALRYRTDQPC